MIRERRLIDALRNIGDVNIKNPANTHVVKFGSKLLALFEAGAPYELDPETLGTIGLYGMAGNVPVEGGERLAVAVDGLPDASFIPKMNGRAHTAHPKRDPVTGRMVGWTWAQDPVAGELLVRLSEYEEKEGGSEGLKEKFGKDYIFPVDLAPHDFGMSENYAIFVFNALTMQPLNFMTGLKGPAECLDMDGRAKVKVAVVRRPGAEVDDVVGEMPLIIEMDAAFAIHFSHAYEEDGKIIAHFSGWPPNDSESFLGAWGGIAPEFEKIPPTFLWRLEVDLMEKKSKLRVAKGSKNVCGEHLKVHPNFQTKKCEDLFVVSSNLIGDSSPPCGYSRLKIEDDKADEKEVESFWWGTRFFCGEPVIAPKAGEVQGEMDGYLLGIVHDAEQDVAFLAVFDLARKLNEGPVCEIECPFAIPHGLHGSWTEEGKTSSYF